MSRVEELVARASAAGDEVLLLVPPFASITAPPLAPQLLKAIAERAGFRTTVLYANLDFARSIGAELYQAITRIANRTLLGERVFTAAAFDLPLLGRGQERLESEFHRLCSEYGVRADWSGYRRAAERAAEWADALAGAVAARGYRVVGSTTTFEQTAASVALLRRVKERCPTTTTVIGGANCEGEMADAVGALSDRIDHVFSQESDLTFPEFLGGLRPSGRPVERTVEGRPVRDLDALPVPSYRDYFDQLERSFPRGAGWAQLWDEVELALESSRGCWWGQKHHCTFCGISDATMGFREKSADRVLEELDALVAEYPLPGPEDGRIRLAMTDNIMPRSYLRTLIPRLRERPRPVRIFYEQKANLTLDEVVALKAAGVASIQPGIESLSTSALQRLKKGVTVPQNIALLRYAASANLSVTWNILTHAPADRLDELEQTLALVPLLHHLQPPSLCRVSVDRFSPYFEQAEAHGVRDVRPLEEYAEVFPEWIPHHKLAYYFRAEFDGASMRHPEIVERVREEVAAWRAAWRSAGRPRPPMLCVARASEPYRRSTERELALIDTRGLPGTETLSALSREQAIAALAPRRLDGDPATAWALERKLGVALDGRFVPLAIAEPALLGALEAEATARRE